jgi:hypothetical protein
MLRQDYRWIESGDRAFLHFRYGCVATIKPDGDRFRTEINWRDLTHAGQVGSMAQGRRFIERWIWNRQGWPGGKRR